MARQAKTTGRTPEYEGWEQRSSARLLDPVRQRSVKRTRQIVDAARRIVQERGVDGLTVQTVLDATGLSLRAFYQRFAGKDELLLAIFEEAMRDAALFFGTEASAIADPVERLHATVTGLFARSLADESTKQSVPLSREHLRLAAARPVELRYAIEPLVACIEEQIEDGMRAGCVRRTDARRLAALVLHLVSSQIHAVLLGVIGEQETERTGEELWDFCWRAIRAEGE